MALNREEKWLLEEKYEGSESEAFAKDCKRLVTGEPLAYIIDYVPFLSCKILLNSKPLIPRPETEFWVEKALEEINGHVSKNVSVLDLCAGSGCIGIAVLKLIPESTVDFVEIETIHHKTILKNIKENNIDESRCNVYGGNLLQKISAIKKYTHILTNPPYIDPALDRTETSVRTFEPNKALYGGLGGMELIKKIIFDSICHLLPEGQLWIEHEPEQSEEINLLAINSGFSCITHKDQYGVERYSILVIQ